MSHTIDMDKLADALGYETIEWDTDNGCYSGYGCSDPMDRTRDAEIPFYVAANDAELIEIAESFRPTLTIRESE